MAQPSHYYVRQKRDNVQGPIERERLLRFIRAGKAAASMEYSTDGVNWKRGHDVPDLFPNGSPPPEPKPSSVPDSAKAVRQRVLLGAPFVLAGLVMVGAFLVGSMRASYSGRFGW